VTLGARRDWVIDGMTFKVIPAQGDRILEFGYRA
jgi:hypothetical protein